MEPDWGLGRRRRGDASRGCASGLRREPRGVGLDRWTIGRGLDEINMMYFLNYPLFILHTTIQ
jgi:hypothetical protein